MIMYILSRTIDGNFSSVSSATMLLAIVARFQRLLKTPPDVIKLRGLVKPSENIAVQIVEN